MQRTCPMWHLALWGQQCGVCRKLIRTMSPGHGEVSEATMPHSQLLGPDTKPQMFSKAQT